MADEKKSMIFIDASNLLGGWWTYCKGNGFISIDNKTNRQILSKKIDYQKLISEIAKNTDFIRGYFYNSVDEPVDSKKQGFFDKLRSLEVTIVTKKLRHKIVKCKHCQKEDFNVPYQKGVDVALVTEFISLATEKAYEIGIVVSGDNDFVDAINYVKSKGIKVWVASFANCLGEDAMRAVDKVIQLDKLINNICMA